MLNLPHLDSVVSDLQMKRKQTGNFIRHIARASLRNEGYVLVYALIVAAVLTAVVLGVFSVSLNNLKAQQAMVDDMKARYEAEGYLEMVVAEIHANAILPGNITLNAVEEATRDSDAAVFIEAVANIRSSIKPMIEGIISDINLLAQEDYADTEPHVLISSEIQDPSPEDIMDVAFTVPLKILTGNQMLETTLQLGYHIDEGTKESDDVNGEYVYPVTANLIEFKYNSFTVALTVND